MSVSIKYQRILLFFSIEPEEDLFQDPLISLFEYFHVTWYGILIFYALFSVLVDFIFLNLFDQKKYGGPGRYKEYLKNKLNWLYWPVFIMGGVAAATVITFNFSIHIEEELFNHGFSYFELSIPLFREDFPFIFSLLLAFLISSFTLLRHLTETKLFFTKPVIFNVVRSILFDFPLAYMVCISIVRVLNQLIVLYRFYTSDWVPPSFLVADNFFGLRWAHSLLINQIIIGILVSFVPLIMLTRKEMAEKHAKEYIASPILFILAISIPLIILANALNTKLSNINEHFAEGTIQKILTLQKHQSPENTLEILLLYQELEKISNLPDKINLPILLEGTLGASVLFWLGFIFDKLLGNVFDKIFEKIKKSQPVKSTGRP